MKLNILSLAYCLLLCFCLKFVFLSIFSIDIGILLYKYLKNHSIRTLFQDRTEEIISHIYIVPVLRHPYLSLIYRGYWWVTFMTRKLQSRCAICNQTAFFNPSCCLLKKNPALLSPCLLLFQFSSSPGLLSVLSKSSGAVRKSSQHWILNTSFHASLPGLHSHGHLTVPG